MAGRMWNLLGANHYAILLLVCIPTNERACLTALLVLLLAAVVVVIEEDEKLFSHTDAAATVFTKDSVQERNRETERTIARNRGKRATIEHATT